MKEFTTSVATIYISGINDLTINNDTNLCREYKQIIERTNILRKKKFDLVKAAAKLGITENTKDLQEKISALATNYMKIKLGEEPDKRNAYLLVGPTGSGKTLIVSTVTKFLNVSTDG